MYSSVFPLLYFSFLSSLRNNLYITLYTQVEYNYFLYKTSRLASDFYLNYYRDIMAPTPPRPRLDYLDLVYPLG